MLKPSSTNPAPWAFRAHFRRGAFGWNSSKLAIERIHEALAEIRAVARQDPAAAAEGAVLFLERLSPALNQVDSCTGALGNATYAAVRNWCPSSEPHRRLAGSSSMQTDFALDALEQSLYARRAERERGQEGNLAHHSAHKERARHQRPANTPHPPRQQGAPHPGFPHRQGRECSLIDLATKQAGTRRDIVTTLPKPWPRDVRCVCDPADGID